MVKYNLVQLCNNIRQPQVPFSLAIQAILFRGVVKIEGKQVSFLFSDAVEARTKLGSVMPTTEEAPEAAPQRKKGARPAAGEEIPSAELVEEVPVETSLDLNLQLPADMGAETKSATQQIMRLAEKLGAAEETGMGLGVGMGAHAGLTEMFDLAGMDLGELDLSAMELGAGLEAFELGGLGIEQEVRYY